VKNKLFIVLFSLSAFLTADAQTVETISEPTPVPSNIGKFTKNVRKIKYVEYDAEKVRFNVKIEPMSLPDGRKAAWFIIQTAASEVFFENIGGEETARVNFYGRITSKDKKSDGFFEEKLIVTATVEELGDKSTLKPLILRKIFALLPGKYQIGVVVRDEASGASGVKIIKFQIP
jgi:hypothetical protein